MRFHSILLLGLASIGCGSIATSDSRDAGIPDSPPGPPTISPEAIDFGSVGCGTTAAPRAITIRNPGGSPLSFVAIFGNGSSHGEHFVVEPPAGIVPPRSTFDIKVIPPPIPPTGPLTPKLHHDDVFVSLSDGTLGVIPLDQSARGAILLVPELVNMGLVRSGTTATELVPITNVGNSPATVAIASLAPFGGTQITLPPQTSATIPLNFTADPSHLGMTEEAFLALTTSDALCGPLPTIDALARTVDRAASVSSGAGHACSLTPAGRVYCWGANESGQLGDGTTSSRPTPTLVTGLPGSAIGLSTGRRHSCAVMSSGTVMCWGRNVEKQLGHVVVDASPTPVQVDLLFDAITVHGYDSSTCAIRKGGTVVCWGAGQLGQLGNGSSGDSVSPVVAQGVSGAVQLGGRLSAPCARTGGSVMCWGSGADGSSNPVKVPIVIPGIVDATDIGAGGAWHTCAVRQTGAIVCWGDNYTGQLGIGTSDGTGHTPTLVAGIGDAISVGSSVWTSCATRSSGPFACWGGAYGQSAAPLLGVAMAQSFTGSGASFFVRNADGTLLSWGENNQLQLGRSTVSGYDYQPKNVDGFE